MEERQKLGGSLLLAVPRDGHRPVDLVPLRTQLGQLREQGHVRLVEELHLVAKHLEHGLDDWTYVVDLVQSCLESNSLLLRERRDLGSEPQLRSLTIRVGGVARVSEIGKGRRL